MYSYVRIFILWTLHSVSHYPHAHGLPLIYHKKLKTCFFDDFRSDNKCAIWFLCSVCTYKMWKIVKKSFINLPIILNIPYKIENHAKCNPPKKIYNFLWWLSLYFYCKVQCTYIFRVFKSNLFLGKVYDCPL